MDYITDMYKRFKLIAKVFLFKAGLTVRFSKHMPTTSKFLDTFKDKVDLVLYVGANRGQMVNTYLNLFPDIPIVLYEPDKKLALELNELFHSVKFWLNIKARHFWFVCNYRKY